MNKLALFCLVSIAACVLASEEECGEGSRWLGDGCNWCNCINGRGACTKRMCRPGHSIVKAGEPMCTEGSWWKAADGCNTCSCMGGQAACTLKLCLPARPARSASPLVSGLARPARSARQTCEEGAVFTERCNTCTCGADGLKACTKKACNPAVAYSNTCSGTAAFMDENNCNWCNCANGNPVCTLKLCF